MLVIIYVQITITDAMSRRFLLVDFAISLFLQSNALASKDMSQDLQNATFSHKISRVNVDEVHFVKTADASNGVDPLFQPAYGILGDLRIHLPSTTNFTTFSATLPTPVVKQVMQMTSDIINSNCNFSCTCTLFNYVL